MQQPKKKSIRDTIVFKLWQKKFQLSTIKLFKMMKFILLTYFFFCVPSFFWKQWNEMKKKKSSMAIWSFQNNNQQVRNFGWKLDIKGVFLDWFLKLCWSLKNSWIGSVDKDARILNILNWQKLLKDRAV